MFVALGLFVLVLLPGNVIVAGVITSKGRDGYLNIPTA